MELSTIIGIIVSLVGLLGGMTFKHVPFSALANPAAIFMILIGTSGAVLNAFPLKDVAIVGKLFGMVFTNKKSINKVDLIKLIVEFAQLTRKEGILILESNLDRVEDSFMRKGIDLLLTGQTRETIEEIMQGEIDAMEERHQAGALVFTQAGTYAPTLGVLGAVIGLIAALGNMNDMDALGNAISAAFMATVFGIFTGYVLWLPFANKLKRKSKEELAIKHIMLTGVLLLCDGLSPNMVQEKLLTYLAPKERGAFAVETPRE